MEQGDTVYVTNYLFTKGLQPCKVRDIYKHPDIKGLVHLDWIGPCLDWNAYVLYKIGVDVFATRSEALVRCRELIKDRRASLKEQIKAVDELEERLMAGPEQDDQMAGV